MSFSMRMVGVAFLFLSQISLGIGKCKDVAAAADPRARQIKQDNKDETWWRIAGALASGTGRHLSAEQARAEEIQHMMETYFLMGNIGPLINDHVLSLRRAEKYFLRYQLNQSQIQSLTHASPPEPAKIAALEKENADLAFEFGRYYQEWETVRTHIKAILDGGDAALLKRVARIDNEEAGKLAAKSFGLESPGLESLQVPPPGDALRRELLAQKERTDANVEERNQRIFKLQEFRHSVTAETDFTEIVKLMNDHGYFNEDLRIAISARDVTKIQLELDLLIKRLRRANDLYSLAAKLDRELGTQPEDIARLSLLVSPQATRPTTEGMRELAKTHPRAISGASRTALRLQVFEFFDSVVFFGAAGAAIPAVGRAFDSIKAPGMRNFVYWLFSDLYQHHARRKYLNKLFLILHSEANGAELLQQVENLNGGTKDEFLLAMARFPEMRLIWGKVKEEAKAHPDHLNLLQRMETIEPKARDLGTISFIDQSSYTRYIVATLINGGLLLGGKALYSYVKDDDEKKGEEKNPEGEEVTTAMEGQALSDFAVLLSALKPNATVTGDVMEAAAERLWALEQRLQSSNLIFSRQ